jgi:pimeloyl-ACP methyl ester carboxylesterase
LADGESILPVAFDGEFYLPLGHAVRKDKDTTQIVLDRLPSPRDDLPAPLVNARSLFGSIRIFFQKVLNRVVGFEYDYPVLAAVTFDADGEPLYEGNREAIKKLVARANRIVLYIHGIIGETSTMVPSARLAKFEDSGRTRPLADIYELVLAFDYENINTTIEETAKALGQKLAAVGLGPGHGKTLHILAHSMGGLVSRWFVEREGGNLVVQHLIMLGTPNAGSPWPRLEDWATATLGLALNGLTTVTWPAKVIGGLVAAVEAIDVALDEMVPDSSFLTQLAANPDPNPPIPYTLIAGNTSIKPAALVMQPERSNTSLVQRLIGRLTPNAALRLVADQIFLKPNDIAVAVDSMTTLGTNRKTTFTILPAACDHLSYFRDPEGLKVLAGVLTGLRA